MYCIVTNITHNTPTTIRVFFELRTDEDKVIQSRSIEVTFLRYDRRDFLTGERLTDQERVNYLKNQIIGQFEQIIMQAQTGLSDFAEIKKLVGYRWPEEED